MPLFLEKEGRLYFYSHSFTPLKESGRAHVEDLTFSLPEEVNNSERRKVQMSGAGNKLA